MADTGDKSKRDDQQRKDQAHAGPGDHSARLRAELKATLAQLTSMQADFERVASCKHPAGSVKGAVCAECGQEMWPESAAPSA
jgi:hypothetical protein